MTVDTERETMEKLIKKLIKKEFKKKGLTEFIRGTIIDEVNRLFWKWENSHTSLKSKVERLVIDVANLKKAPIRIDGVTLNQFVRHVIDDVFHTWQSKHTNIGKKINNINVRITNLNNKIKQFEERDCLDG